MFDNHPEFVTHWLRALPAKFQFIVSPNRSDSVFSISHHLPLDKRTRHCYVVRELNSIFRAGRNSPPAVKSASA